MDEETVSLAAALDVWVVETLSDGAIRLTAPNGVILMNVRPETADLVGRMLIDEAGMEYDTY